MIGNFVGTLLGIITYNLFIRDRFESFLNKYLDDKKGNK